MLERARAEIAAGRLWKARDRLTGVLRQDPYDQAVLGLLGDVYSQMGDLPAAARCWLLTERSSLEVDRARDALMERHGNDPALILESIPFGGELECYPVPVRSRLDELVVEAGKRGEKLLEARRRGRERDRQGERRTFGMLGGCLGVAFAAVFISLCVGALLRGFEGLLRLLRYLF